MKQLIKKLLDLVRQALSNAPDDPAAHDALIKKVEALTAEKAELESLTGEINEVIELATAATSGGGGGEAPADANTVRMGFRSKGQETFNVTIENSGVSEERAELLQDVFNAAEAGANSQPPGGSKFESELYYDYQDTHKSLKLDNGDQKDAADEAVLEAFLAEVKARRANARPTE